MVTKEEVIENKDKFFKRIVNDQKSDCILFNGYTCKDGYGQFQFRHNAIKKNVRAHRASYIIFNNEELSSDDVIMHSCDNPLCVNPNHLSKGTHATNVADRVKKRRCARGESNGRYKHGRYVKQMGVT